MTDTRRTCSQCGTRPAKPRYRRCARCRGTEYDACACGAQKTKTAKACAQCAKKRRGAEHGSWRGGLIVDKQGYVRQFAPDHPRANMGRYVKQHHLVMERHLGRLLLPGENVHHRNGDRSDNRIENLELWVSHQPSGQRVEDLLEWAHEIISRYSH